MSKNIKNSNLKNYIFIVCMIISVIGCSFFIYKHSMEKNYPEWGNGERVYETTATIAQVYDSEETDDIFSQFIFKDKNGNICEKWIRTNGYEEYQQIESVFPIYYLEDSPVANSRLTNPCDKKMIDIYSVLILTFISTFFVSCVFLLRNIRNNMSKNRKTKK